MVKQYNKEFTVDCNKWVRGGFSSTLSYGSVCLLNELDNMCCLGFDCLQTRGLKIDDIRNVSMPEACSPYLARDYDDDAAVINDDSLITDRQRIRKLRNLLKKYGVRVRFKNIPKE